MKTIVYYFSGTGNSFAVARDIASLLNSCETAPMTELAHSSSRERAGAIGLVFPVYFQKLPAIVERLVKMLRFDREQYVFAAATHNGYPGNALYCLKRQIERQGGFLSAGFEILMPGNMIALVDASTSAHEQTRRIHSARAQVELIAQDIESVIQNSSAITFSMKDALRGIRNDLIIRGIYRGEKKFWTTGRCSSCRICEKACPTGNIVFENGRPQRRDRCEFCLACLHWCPEHAVQIGSGTLKRGRYHHPAVSLNEMLEGSPHEADVQRH